VRYNLLFYAVVLGTLKQWLYEEVMYILNSN